jgi:hypothetical protein
MGWFGKEANMSTESGDRAFEAWAESLQAEYDAFLRQTWAAMQAARKGHWIADTEEHVREAGESFRQKALEKLLQAKVAEGQGSFSPSTRRRLDEQGSAEGHAPDGGGPRGSTASGVAAARRRPGRAGG